MWNSHLAIGSCNGTRMIERDKRVYVTKNTWFGEEEPRGSQLVMMTKLTDSHQESACGAKQALSASTLCFLTLPRRLESILFCLLGSKMGPTGD